MRYVRATLDEAAARAGFRKGTLYNYFPDGEEELLWAVLNELVDELLTHMEPLLHARWRTKWRFGRSRCLAVVQNREVQSCTAQVVPDGQPRLPTADGDQVACFRVLFDSSSLQVPQAM